MFCRNCGKQHDDGAGFCDGCGTPLKPVVEAPVGTPATPKSSKRGLFIALAVGIVVLVGVLVAVFVLFPRPMDDAKYEAQVSDSLADVMDIPEDIYTVMDDAGNTYGDQGIGSENIAAFQDTLARSSSAIESAKADLDGLVPPKDYEKQHEDLLASLDQLLEVTGSLSEMVSRIKPEDTAGEISSEYEERFFGDVRDGVRAYADMGSALGDLGLGDLLPAILDELGNPEDF